MGRRRQERLTWLHSLNERLRSERFEELSIIDPMTGLGNRHAIKQWPDELADSRKDEAIAFIPADIDHFKHFSIAFGHMRGDDCIRRVSNALSSTASRFGGRVFRFCGEEFVVVLVGSGPERVRQAAETPRQRILQTHQPHRTAMTPYVS